MNIYTPPSKNFGDAVNPRFWKELTGNNNIESNKNKPHYITTGSIMCLVQTNSIILGTGFMYKDGDLGGGDWGATNNKKNVNPSNVISVRGPLSRKQLLKLNVECPENYGDPLILMPCIYNKRSNVTLKFIIGIIPHYVDKNNENYKLLRKNLQNKGYIVKFIDIEIGDNYEKIIDEINCCTYIISSSLHGIIMGIIYKKQTIFVEFSNSVNGNGFKFQDFFKSIDINYKNQNIYDVNLLDNIINVDYKILQEVSKKLISVIPFIENDKKESLKQKIQLFYATR
jgi:pyruvyltransferase